MISPRCILMQGLSTLFPFIHIQMCSYCLFALGPFKMPFWNMLFDKHIIGQVPAVIRALFNVSKLESEWGTPEPTAIHSSPSSPLGVPWATGRWVGQTKPWLWHWWPFYSFHLDMERLSQGGKPREDHREVALYAGRLDSCTLSQRCDSRTAI